MSSRILALVLAGTVGAAAARAGEGDNSWREAINLYRKFMSGEELTQEDETAISKFRERWVARQEQQRLGRWVPRGSTARKLRSGLIEYGDPGALNVQEFARFRLADLRLLEKKPDPAIKTLSRVLRSDTTRRARSLAAFSVGLIKLREQKDPDGAKVFFYQVSGDLSDRARQLVVAPMLKEGRTDEAVRELETFLKRAKDPYTRTIIIKQIEEVLTGSGNLRELESFLKKVPRLISKEDAVEGAREEAKRFKERQRANPRSGRGRWRMMGTGPRTEKPQPAPASRTAKKAPPAEPGEAQAGQEADGV